MFVLIMCLFERDVLSKIYYVESIITSKNMWIGKYQLIMIIIKTN